ncbi:ferric reductase NAD binding domain-containing protein [Mycena sp. CBHHK59/15]|nr:ferric reductase NAD binding domain-containing protein [Mycena sp. CBHHK59/15]
MASTFPPSYAVARSTLKTVDPDRAPRTALASLYPKEVWWFLATFIFLVSLCHFTSFAVARFSPRHAAAPARHAVSLRRLPLAVLNLFRAVAFRWTITVGGAYTLNLADFMLSAAYIAVLFTWTFINSKNLEGQKYDPKYWANRCAHIAASQLPLTAALGMKNNLLSLLTGVSYDKARPRTANYNFEYLHRMTARIICVMLWVHAFGRVALDIGADAYEPWFKCGVVGASALTLLALLSLRPLRTGTMRITLAGAYVHSAEFGYGAYIWPALLLWALDRVLRLLRIGALNSRLLGASCNKHGTGVALHATVTLLAPHFLRISIPRPAYFQWRAGQSAFLTLCGVYRASAAEAHPFTIMDAPPLSSPEGAASKDDEKAGSVESGKELENAAGAQLAFILRVRSGFTRRLLDAVAASPSGVEMTCTALVDGPYGAPPAVQGFDTVVFVCGGSGVSFALPLFLDILQCARGNTNPRCRRVVFVWAVRDAAHIAWIADALCALLPPLPSSHPLSFDIRLHVTAAPADTQSFASDSAVTDPEAPATPTTPVKNISESKLLAFPGVQVLAGRPDVRAILDGEIERAMGAVSVNVCGTTELAASVRRALRGVGRFVDVLRGGPSVVLHVEGFGGS